MKKVVKKVVALSVAAVMVCSFFGCTKKGEDGAKGGIHKVEILSNSASAKSFWEARVKEFNSTIGKEKNIELVLTTKVDAAYNQALDIAMQSDKLPDMFAAGDVKKLHELDMIIPLDELKGTEDMLEKYSHLTQENYHKVGDDIYSYPWGMTLRGLVYNKDMFKAAGIVDKDGNPTPPETYEEMVEYAKKLTDKSKMQYGIIFPVKWTSWVASDILDASAPSAGHAGYDPVTGEYDYTVAQPLLEAVMQIKNDGSCYPGSEGMDNDPARARFAEGQIGMKFAYSFDVAVFNDQFKATCDWGVAPLPVADKDKKYKQFASVGATFRVSRRAIERHGVDVMSTVYNWWASEDTAIELYKQGMNIPCDWNLVKDIKLENTKPGWVDFCKLAEISITAPLTVPADMNGRVRVNETVVNDIWSGKSGMDMLKKASDTINDGVKAYKETYPDIDYSIYVDKNWNSER